MEFPAASACNWKVQGHTGSPCQGVPPKKQCTDSITSSRNPVCLEINFWWFLTKRLSRNRTSQVMYLVKFGPIVFNFGFFSIGTFFWDTLCMENTDMHISEAYFTYHILHSWRARPCCMKIFHGSHLLDQGPGLQHLILWGLNAVLIALLPPCIANTVRIQNNFFKGTTVQMCMKHKEGHVRWRANVTTSSMTPHHTTL